MPLKNENSEPRTSELPCSTPSRSKAEEVSIPASGNDAQNSFHDTEITTRLNQELALSSTHRNEIECHWRQILRREKFKELHREIDPLIEYHKENVGRKKEVINSSQREFDHLQELYRNAMVTNIFRMDELISIHDDQVIGLESTFRERVKLLLEEFSREVADINAKSEVEKETVHVCIEKQRQKDAHMTELINQDTQNEVEEIKNRNLEDINNLRFVLDSKLEDLEEQFEQANLEYTQSTDFTKAAYQQLKENDTQLRKEIRRKTRHADRLQSDIQRFQLIAKQEEALNRERQQALLERKTRAIQKLQMTKDEMAKFRKDQQHRLIVLSRRANEKKDALKQQCTHAERVKKIALSCHKWETSREQFASLLRSVALNQDDMCAETDGKDAEMYQLSKQSILLRNNAHRFWDKYSLSQLDVLTLQKRVNGLKRKEQGLKKKLKMYQDGITVNDDVLKSRNPLLVINGKMNDIQGTAKVLNGRKVPRRLTVVDANQILTMHKMAR